MRRVLVTGVTGFAGSHLVDYMLERGDCEIFGIQRWRSRTENIEHFLDRITLRRVRPARRLLDPRHAREGAPGLDLPPRRAVVRADLVERADRVAHHQRARRRSTSSRRCAASGSSAASSSRARARSTAWSTRTRCRSGDQPAAAAVALRGEQGGAGHARLPVLDVVEGGQRAHARLQPRGPAARPGVRGLGLRQADRRHREGPQGAGAPRRQPRGAARLHRRARHGARPTGWRSRSASPARSTTSAAARRGASARCSTCCSA